MRKRSIKQMRHAGYMVASATILGTMLVFTGLFALAVMTGQAIAGLIIGERKSEKTWQQA